MNEFPHVASVAIQDTFGITSLRFNPATITRIRGGNGTGKSSIVRGFMRCFESDHDPSIIRRGAEKSIVSFTLTDGTSVTRICEPMKRRRTDPEDAPIRYKTTLEVLDSDGLPRKAPATYLAELGEPIAIDPGKLLRLDVTKKPQLEEFTAEVQKVMALAWTRDEIMAALEPPELDLHDSEGRSIPDNRTRVELSVPIPQIAGDLNLKKFKTFIVDVGEARRRLGRTRDDADGAINSAQKSLPPDEGVDYAAQLAAAERERDDLRERKSTRQLQAERLKAEALRFAVATETTAHQDIDREIDEEIRALERERARRKAEATGIKDRQREATDNLAKEEATAIERELGAPLAETIARIAGLKESVESQRRAAFTRELIDKQTAAYRAASAQYNLLTDFIARLEESMRAKLADCPIGLVFDPSGESVTLDGIPWQYVNTARRVEVVIDLCTRRSGRLGILFLDDAEHLDAQTMTALENGLAAAGYQLVEAIISDACICGHDHPKEGTAIQSGCLQCRCKHYEPAPLRVETYEPAAA